MIFFFKNSAEDVIYHNDGSDITEEFFARYGFDTPILIRSAPDSLKKLRCTMPLSTVSLDEIRDLIGEDNSEHPILRFAKKKKTSTFITQVTRRLPRKYSSLTLEARQTRRCRSTT